MPEGTRLLKKKADVYRQGMFVWENKSFPRTSTGARPGGWFDWMRAAYDQAKRYGKFLADDAPDTYTWIPFGGGRRRCIGASFAHMEMDVVLRTMLQRVQLLPTTAPNEPWSFAGVVWAAGEGGQAAVRHLVRKPVAPELAAAAR